MNTADANRAWEWYTQHEPHVQRLMKLAQDRGAIPFEPSPSDSFQPQLWKAESWLWFFVTASGPPQ
jgi:hypothetical protein